VLRVESGTVFIDHGAAHGLKPGQRLEVLSYREITHPVTGKTMRLRNMLHLSWCGRCVGQARCLVLESTGDLITGLSVTPVVASAGQ